MLPPGVHFYVLHICKGSVKKKIEIYSYSNVSMHFNIVCFHKIDIMKCFFCAKKYVIAKANSPGALGRIIHKTGNNSVEAHLLLQ